ncbi:MAG: hypothetical protein DME26_22205, partial [Verrucomicrobia bacterium]
FENVTLGGRRLTQAFRVITGTNEFSLGERKKLFQNTVWWLLNCRLCSVLQVHPEGSASPETLMVGEELTYQLKLQHSGECEALSVSVSSVLPSGMEFIEARSERGQWSYRSGIVTFEVGRLTSGATNELEIIVRPTVPGLLTNYVTLQSLNETGRALDDNSLEIVTEVLPALRLQIEKPLVGPVQIRLTGPAGRMSVLEASSSLSDWVPVSTNALNGGSAVVADPQSMTAPRRFYRGGLK